MSAVQRPNAIPIVPTKTANHAALVPGAFGANARRRSEPIGQSDAEIAQRMPRPRSESVTTPGMRSARTPRKKKGNKSPRGGNPDKKNQIGNGVKTGNQK